MTGIVGKYDFESGENIEEYLAALGVGLVLRRVRGASRPWLEIGYAAESDEWWIKTESPFNVHTIKFRAGMNVEDKTYDARACFTTGEIMGEDKIVLEQKCEEGPHVTTVVEKGPEDLLRVTHAASTNRLVLTFRKQQA